MFLRWLRHRDTQHPDRATVRRIPQLAVPILRVLDAHEELLRSTVLLGFCGDTWRNNATDHCLAYRSHIDFEAQQLRLELQWWRFAPPAPLARVGATEIVVPCIMPAATQAHLHFFESVDSTFYYVHGAFVEVADTHEDAPSMDDTHHAHRHHHHFVSMIQSPLHDRTASTTRPAIPLVHAQYHFDVHADSDPFMTRRAGKRRRRPSSLANSGSDQHTNEARPCLMTAASWLVVNTGDGLDWTRSDAVEPDGRMARLLVEVERGQPFWTMQRCDDVIVSGTTVRVTKLEFAAACYLHKETQALVPGSRISWFNLELLADLADVSKVLVAADILLNEPEPTTPQRTAPSSSPVLSAQVLSARPVRLGHVFTVSYIDGSLESLQSFSGGTVDEQWNQVMHLVDTYVQHLSVAPHRAQTWSNTPVLKDRSLTSIDHPSRPWQILGFSVPPPSSTTSVPATVPSDHVDQPSALPRPKRQRRTY